MSIDQISNTPIKFFVCGRSGTLGDGTRSGGFEVSPAIGGQMVASVVVEAHRDSGPGVEIEAVPGKDVVVLHVEDGPVLYLNPATARDLLSGPTGPQRGSSIFVGSTLPWPGAPDGDPGADAARGIGDWFRAVLKGFQLIRTGGSAGQLVAAEIVARIDSQVEAGVYRLPAKGPLSKLKDSGNLVERIPVADGPQLVLIHGTFVETTSTFGKLWEQHPDVVDEFFRGYRNRVYALDHPTLGASPVDNARTLVNALPDGAVLHLLTHSRGGLVAEVLVRCAGQAALSPDELAMFDDEHGATRNALVALHLEIQRKKIVIERVVRVACPAHGTLLAARRLDVYVSVLGWLLQTAGVPALPQLLAFMGDVARQRADPAVIPGLEAMIPGTPLVRWLNAAPKAVPGELRVIAGDIQAGGGVLGWTKALLADAYYLTANDIVVHTGSMYGGAPRAGGASFLLEQGSDTTHFAYFANKSTAQAAARGLLQSQPAAFAPIGPLSQAGEDWSGRRGAAVGTRGNERPEQPALFVLPGILGSNLKAGKDRIWLSAKLLGNFDRLAYRPGEDGIEPDGPLNISYDALASHFDAEYEVVRFGYDWRAPLEGQASDLAKLIRDALQVREKTGKPVRIIAHSMGGLLARTVELVDADTWKRFMAQPQGRLLMLGTPNGGSWAPMQVLSGDDRFGNTLAVLGSPFASAKARQQMAEMPGLLQLQASLLDPGHKLSKQATWQALADADYSAELKRNWWQRYAGEAMTSAWRWGVPTQSVLDAAVELRQRLDAQKQERMSQWSSKVLLVVGHADATPYGFQEGDNGFEYLEVDTGDGRVPLESALLPGVATWSVDAVHGDLSTRQEAFAAYTELLSEGNTTKLRSLAALRASTTSEVHLIARRPRRDPFSAWPAPTVDNAFKGVELASSAWRKSPRKLRVTVLNGNLVFVEQPLLLGHYSSLQLTGTEQAIDRHMGGILLTALHAGLYPDAVNNHRIFHNTRPSSENPWALPKPRAAIVVGLGHEGALTAATLESTVCQGVKAWSQRAAEEAGARGEMPPMELELAATLVGSGGLGISPGESARAIARGVLTANQQLVATNWPLVGRLTLVEQYLDRAGEAWRGVAVFAQAEFASLSLDEAIATGSSAKRRQPETGYRSANYDLITATSQSDGKIEFALDSRRARAEVRARQTQPVLVRKLVAQAATATTGDPELGLTLFKLLVPLELKPFLAGRDRMVLQLDLGTAAIPWELLDTPPEGEFGHTQNNGNPREPWSIRTGLLRRLEAHGADMRSAPRDARTNDAVLVIGEPKIGDPRYSALPGALAEAESVRQAFDSANKGEQRATLLLKSPFDVIINTLMKQPWRVIHIAGHGEPVKKTRTGEKSGGVVLSDGVFLGPAEIRTLDVVPELVFINCCHLGGHEANTVLRIGAEASSFAAAVADELVGIGVRCVVAAGWAVDDEVAAVFARSFYTTLLAGRPFVDAVTQARRDARARNPASKTWAAYQCYGDPNWIYTDTVGDPVTSRAWMDTLQAIPSAAGLALALENLAVDAELDVAARRKAIDQLCEWERLHAARWGGMGAVAEAFGVAWNAAGDMDRAAKWLERAVQAVDGSASLKAAETLVNLTVRLAYSNAEGSSCAEKSCERIRAAIKSLDALLMLEETPERLALRGSAIKRLGQLTSNDADLHAAKDAYEHAETLAMAKGDTTLYYAALNRIWLELALDFGQAKPKPLDASKTMRVRACLDSLRNSQPDFWVYASATELAMAEALSEHCLAREAPELAKRWADLYLRVPAAVKWRSVADQASFVLSRYADAESGSEAAAAMHLLAQLRSYAS